MPIAEIDGRAVEYVRRGAGTPVIFSSPTWWPLDAWQLSGVPELSVAHDAVAFNHRGIGRSAATDGAYTVESMSHDLLALADALGLDRVHLAGYANGAAVALAAARRHPDRVRSLTLAAPSLGFPASAPSQRDATRRDIEDIGFEAHIRAYPATSAHPSFERDRPAAAAALSDALWFGGGTLESFLKHVEARGGYAALEIAAGVAVPALVLIGAEDVAARGALSQVDAARAVAAALPGSRLTVAEGVGHMPFWEAPELWNTVLAFLEEVDS
jgi:pimeloyl-ACP methyl ester carboxylesterase